MGQQRTEPDVHTHRECNDGQWNQKELDGEGWRGNERASRRGLALDKFVHVCGNGENRLGHTRGGQVLPFASLKGQGAPELPAAAPPLLPTPLEVSDMRSLLIVTAI